MMLCNVLYAEYFRRHNICNEPAKQNNFRSNLTLLILTEFNTSNTNRVFNTSNTDRVFTSSTD